MADGISADFDGLNHLAASLGTVPANSGPLINSALQVTSNKILQTWRGKLVGSATLPGLPGALSYDVSVFRGFGVSVLESEIGFDKARSQGPLGNISEYGTPRTPGRGFGIASLEENEADLTVGMSKAVDDALKAAGL